LILADPIAQEREHHVVERVMERNVEASSTCVQVSISNNSSMVWSVKVRMPAAAQLASWLSTQNI
jgi:hypothetical protein